MELGSGAGVGVMESTMVQHSHRVADPQDPPRELSGLGWGAAVALGLTGVLSLARIVVSVNLRSAASGEGDLNAAHDAYSIWVGISGLVFLIAAGAFIAWFFGAYKNLRRLGLQNLRFGSGWAIGGWFIPIFGMIRPKQIANDIWRGSERGVEASTHWQQVRVPSLLHWWWGLFLLQGLVVYGGQQVNKSGWDKVHEDSSFHDGLSQIKSGAVIDIAGDVVGIAGVVLAIMVVRQITARLDADRSDALGAAAAFAPSSPPPPAPGQPANGPAL
jgi:hypothetical protein